MDTTREVLNRQLHFFEQFERCFGNPCGKYYSQNAIAGDLKKKDILCVQLVCTSVINFFGVHVTLSFTCLQHNGTLNMNS